MRSLFLRLPEGITFSFTPGQFISIAIPLRQRDPRPPLHSGFQPGGHGTVGNRLQPGAGRRRIGISVPAQGWRPTQFHRSVRALHAGSRAGGRDDFRRRGAPRSRRSGRCCGGRWRSPPRRRCGFSMPPAHGASCSTRTSSKRRPAASHTFSFEPILGQPGSDWSGLSGTLIDHLKRRFVDADERRDRAFYLCGVGQGVIEQRDLLRKAGYARRAVLYERW